MTDVFRVIAEGANGISEALFFEQSDPESKWLISKCDFEQLDKFILHYIMQPFKKADPFDSLRGLYPEWKQLKQRYLGKRFVSQVKCQFLIWIATLS